LKAPINISESSENLNSEEQVNEREKIYKKDEKHSSHIDNFTSELVEAMDQTKGFDDYYEKSGY
jgi:hypothetical protein